MKNLFIRIVALGCAAAGLVLGLPNATAEARTPSVVVGKGAHVVVTGCTAPSCAWITVSATGLHANRAYTLACRDDYPDHGRPFITRRITTDGNGHFSESAGYCVYGYPGHHVWVTIGQHPSNHYTW
jgi:hypothetical protein